MSELVLRSECLLSKWGFNDGDIPDEVLDYCDQMDMPYPPDWHVTLRALVRERLLPLLREHVEVYDIETSHNPIRARSVNGAVVDDIAMTCAVTLTPVSERVPFADVLAAASVSVPLPTNQED